MKIGSYGKMVKALKKELMVWDAVESVDGKHIRLEYELSDGSVMSKSLDIGDDYFVYSEKSNENVITAYTVHDGPVGLSID